MKLHVPALGASLLLMILPLAAQETLRGPDPSPATHVPGVDVLPIAGKPFSAKTRTDWTRTLNDGSTVKLHLTAGIARDSDGRVYRERHTFIPGLSSQETHPHDILIYDPVAKSQTDCTLALKRCVVSDYQPRTTFKEMPAGAFDGGKRFLARESLGTRTMDGFDVTGTRETTMVRPGVMGNDQPVVSSREFWYSAQLETNLAVTRKLPAEGLQVIQLSDVTTNEPAAELFQPPVGFAIVDSRLVK